MQKLIVIPARGGSKGIPRKNIYPMNGKPLLEYTLDILQEAALENTDIVVSTDSEDIRKVAEKYRGIHIIDRPAEISGDNAPTEAALLHAMMVMETEKGIEYGAVITLQPTSPLRKADTLRKFVDKFEKDYPVYDAMLSLTESRSDYWVEKQGAGFKRLYEDAPRRRQDRKPIYIENSAYYITDAGALKKGYSVLGTRTNGFLITEFEAIDINEKADLIIAECMLKRLEEKDLNI